jgi:hygromycin-B 7''-O-kinase
MVPTNSLLALAKVENYRQSLTDPTFWEPFVRQVCTRYGWSCDQIRPGHAGTFPTFIVDQKRVVKFFGPLFDGENSWQVEFECAELMTGLPGFPVAKAIVSGDLMGQPRWHYIVFEYMPGVSIGEVYEDIPIKGKLELAIWMGKWLSKIHRIRVKNDSVLPRLSLDRMNGWFRERWSNTKAKWPEHMADQLGEYLNENITMIQADADCFIHADLTCDHLLGQIVDLRWNTNGLIDFGDAKIGNIFYELAALHLDLFACDKHLLAAFLNAYGLNWDPALPTKLMTTALMHQFDVIGPLFALKPELSKFSSINEMAKFLWNIE